MNAISSELRKEIQKTASYEDFLIPLMNYCAECIENKQYVLPEEGHTFYRVLLVSSLLTTVLRVMCSCVKALVKALEQERELDFADFGPNMPLEVVFEGTMAS